MGEIRRDMLLDSNGLHVLGDLQGFNHILKPSDPSLTY